MKRFFFILSVALLCGALSCPSLEAQSRGRNNGNNGGGTPTHNSGSSSRGQQTARPAGSTQAPKPQSPKPANVKPAQSSNKGNNVGTRPGNNNAATQPATRPGNNNAGGQPATRPGNNNSGGQPATRPGNNGHGNGQGATPSNPHTRPSNGVANPSNRPGAGSQPGAQQPGGNKPGGNNHGGNHPGGPQPPMSNNFGPGLGHDHGHGYGPGGPAWGHVPNHAPYRPMMQPPRPYWRPTPPPAFRPGPRYPIISTILGVTLGTAINLSLDYLFNQGYAITGYTNNAVYLNDVPQLNLIWPNATMYYDHGRLVGSEFVYSTPYYDMSRYYNTYNRLLNAYGAPIVTNALAGGGMECSWFGYDGQYVTLQFVSALANNGSNRFYTTLSFGR